MVEKSKKEKTEKSASAEKKKGTKKNTPEKAAEAPKKDSASVKSSKKNSPVDEKPKTKAQGKVSKVAAEEVKEPAAATPKPQRHGTATSDIGKRGGSSETGTTHSKSKSGHSSSLTEIPLKRHGSKPMSEASGKTSVKSDGLPRHYLGYSSFEAAGEGLEDFGEGMHSKPVSGYSEEMDVDFYDRDGPPTPPTTSVSQGFDPNSTQVPYYIDSSGDIINEMVPEPDFGDEISQSTRSSVSIPCDLDECPPDVPYQEDSDEEEDRVLRERFPGVFTEHEPWLTPVNQTDNFQQDESAYPEDEDEAIVAEDESFFVFKYTHMDMSCRGLHDLLMVQRFTGLKSMSLANNFLRTLKELSKMVNLVKLNVVDNEIKEFLDIPTKVLMSLQEINMSRNHVTKILCLKPFWALTIVNLSYNRLTTVDNFQDCQYLRVLNLSHNMISAIRNLICPYLVILILKANELEDISGLEHCRSVRYLNISKNKISSLSTLRCMPRLMELRCGDNLITDMLELEALKPLLNLSTLRLEPNTCVEIGMARHMLIFMLPQLILLDGKNITPEEIVEARNTFGPTILKRSYEDHADSTLEKATQSATLMFQDFCNLYPLPPMVLLVGSPKSDANRLATFIKTKLHYNVLLGGVHSTATTIEGGNSKNDIPISLESFLELKNRGDMLSTSNILGRMCGFSMSQVIKASERRALLVAAIPLSTAICLKHWNFKPKFVLLLPSGRPRFGVDTYLAAEAEKKLHPSKQSLAVDLEAHDHLIHFAERTAPGVHKGPIVDPEAKPMHSILKAHHENEDSTWKVDENMALADSKADVNVSLAKLADSPSEVDPSSAGTSHKKKRGTTYFGDEANKYEPAEEIVQVKREIEIGAMGATAFKLGERTTDDINGNLDLKTETCVEEVNREGLFAGGITNLDSESLKDSPPFTVTNRLRRLQRLLAPLLTQTKNADFSTVYPNPDIQLPAITPDIKTQVDWRKTILRSQVYNTLLDSDDPYFMVLEPTMERPESGDETAQFRSSLIPLEISLENPPAQAGSTALPIHRTDLDKFELIVRKVETPLIPEEDEEAEEDELTEEGDEAENDEVLEGFGDSTCVEARGETQETGSDQNSGPLQVHAKKLNFLGVDEMKQDQDFEPGLGPRDSFEEEEGEYDALEYGGENAEMEGEMEDDLPISPDWDGRLPYRGVSMGVLIRRSVVGEDDSDDESAHVSNSRRFKHRDALEKAIMKTREDYLQYHLENPGFFSAVVDTTDVERSNDEIYNFAKMVLRQFQDGTDKYHLVDTHAGKNEIDKPVFINEKLRHFKAQSKEWSKGYHHPLQHMRGTNSSYAEMGTIFQRKRRPTNLMDPSFSRPLGIAKVKQLKHVASLRQLYEKEKYCRENVKLKQERQQSTTKKCRSKSRSARSRSKSKSEPPRSNFKSKQRQAKSKPKRRHKRRPLSTRRKKLRVPKTTMLKRFEQTSEAGEFDEEESAAEVEAAGEMEGDE